MIAVLLNYVLLVLHIGSVSSPNTTFHSEWCKADHPRIHKETPPEYLAPWSTFWCSCGEDLAVVPSSDVIFSPAVTLYLNRVTWQLLLLLIMVKYPWDKFGSGLSVAFLMSFNREPRHHTRHTNDSLVGFVAACKQDGLHTLQKRM